MRHFFPALTLFLAAAAPAAFGNLLDLHYVLTANVPSETGFKVVNGAPASVSRFKILETGNYCDVALDRVEYLAYNGDYAHEAFHQPDGYAVPEGTVYAINISFTQHTWTNADCTLSVVSNDGGGGGGNPGTVGVWFDLGTVQGPGVVDADYTRRCGRTIRESLDGVQCYLSQGSAGEFFCKDPKQRKALLQQFSCVRSVFGPTLEPGYSIDWNQPL